MIVQQLYNAISTRLQANTSLGALLSNSDAGNQSAIYDNFAAGGEKFPYLVIDFADSTSDDAFLVHQAEITVRIHLMMSTRPAETTNSSTILQYIYGTPDSSGGYGGLHRWTPSLIEFGSSPWQCEGGMVWTGTFTNHSEYHYEWITQWKVRVFNTTTL